MNQSRSIEIILAPKIPLILIESIPTYGNLHAFTECCGERNAVEIVAHWALVNRGDVEENDEAGEETQGGQHADDDPDHFAALVDDVESYVRQECEREQESENEPDEVGVVVHHRQESDYEQDDED